MKERAARKEMEEEKKRKATLKAMGAVMKNIVSEREMARKARHGGYVELSGSEERAAQVAKEAREEFRRALRANKAKLDDSLKNRPSLLERLEHQNVAAAAGTKALSSVKDAILGDGGEDDDLFDEFEKMKLGLQ